MCSFEIDAKLKKNNYSIAKEELYEVKETSNQLKQIILEKVRDVSSQYLLKTDDGYAWKVFVSNK